MIKRPLLFYILIFALTGCEDDDSADKAQVSFEVNITNAGEPVSLHDTLHLEKEYDLYLSVFKLYLSEIKAVNDNGEIIAVKNVALLDPGNPGANTFSASIPADSYQSLSIGFGVDPVQNNSDPADFANEHPLSSYQTMYWTMLKYRFAKLEGKANSRLNGPDNIFISYHPGTDGLYQTRDFEQAFSAKAGRENKISLSIDLNEVLDGPAGTIDLATEATTHSTPEDIHIAEKLMKNLAASAEVKF